MITLLVWVLAFIFLLGTFILTAFSTSLRRVLRRNSQKELEELGRLFFYRPVHLYFLPQHEYEGLIFASLSTLNFCRFLFAFTASWLLFIEFNWFPFRLWNGLFLMVGLILLSFTFADYLPRLLASLWAKKILPIFAPLASIFLVVAFPITYLFQKLSQKLFRSINFEYLNEPITEGKQEIFDIIEKSDVEERLEPQDKKLIESVFTFQDLIVREVMVPRISLFCLPSETPIKEASGQLHKEGYSRVPIYKGTIDHVVGVLMYKDILAKYMEASDKNDSKLLEQPVDTIVKPVLYTPETKKISHLLQEFRKRQMHLAIVVDEYGGTEGIVTIEDILEKIVGDIEDEYDQEEELYITLPDGSIVVDSRISILDLEEQLGIILPEEGDYDTLGGYIFHKAGEIPTCGFVIKQDHFDLEVLKAGERSIEKVKIKLKNS